MSFTYRGVHVVIYLWSHVAYCCQIWETGRCCCCWRQAARSRIWPMFPHSNQMLNNPTWTGIMKVYRLAGSVVASHVFSRLARDWVGGSLQNEMLCSRGTDASSTCEKKAGCSALWHILVFSHILLILYCLFFLYFFCFFFTSSTSCCPHSLHLPLFIFLFILFLFFATFCHLSLFSPSTPISIHFCSSSSHFLFLPIFLSVLFVLIFTCL